MQKPFCTPNGFSKFVSVIFSNYCVLTLDIKSILKLQHFC